jgi:hypothetical protein
VVHQIKTIKLVELNFVFKENALFQHIENKTEIVDNISNFDNIKPHQTLMVVYNSPNCMTSTPGKTR